MKNRDVYLHDPATWKLANEGVANVNDSRSTHELAVLRQELKSFVCEGQYKKGLRDILDTYLKNVEREQQPAVWVSGFFGSGKSHLVKMLRALWVNTEFEDGSAARAVATLPEEIKGQLTEFNIAAKHHGGAHAASGTLGSGEAGSVRLALLGIVFRSAGLPEKYAAAQLVMWLRSQGLLEKTMAHVKEQGADWQEELDNMYFADGLHSALTTLKPDLFSSREACRTSLEHVYPYRSDVTSDEMIASIRHAVGRNGEFPLTLIVLDEIQQYIGEEPQRSAAVQELVEACCKSLGGKLLFVGTGQTAITGTPNLKKLEGRFTLRIELSDSDVDAVVRNVVLQKKPSAVPGIDTTMRANLGEISRHLYGTAIGHRQSDTQHFAADYPLLPVRRRFWELCLRALDPTGTDSQLRNQLTMVFKAIRSNLDAPIGHVVAGDHVYWESADTLLQRRMLPRRLYEETAKWRESTDPDEVLRARACAVVFLVNRLAAANAEAGIRATAETVADLLVEDLSAGSTGLRATLPALLDSTPLLLKVKDEYRIQTAESAAWMNDFEAERASLSSQTYRIDTERQERLRRAFDAAIRAVSLSHGASKAPRSVSVTYDPALPADAARKLYAWVRDGWAVDEQAVRAEALQAGNQSPTVYVHIPRVQADALRRSIIDIKAAAATLEKRGTPSADGALEARQGIETIRQSAERQIAEIIDEALTQALVLQAGGVEVGGTTLQNRLADAARNSLARLYPQFSAADHAHWDKVYARAKQGDPAALTAVGHPGDAATNALCKAILGFIGGSKYGSEIRDGFEGPPYGWSGDAVDGGLQVLLVAGLIRGTDPRGHAIEPQRLDRRDIGKSVFRPEATTISTAQRVEVRKLLQLAAIPVDPGKEAAALTEFARSMKELAARAGGEPPKPSIPDTKSLGELLSLSGNDLVLAAYNKRDELKDAHKEWTEQAELIESRWTQWLMLKGLLKHAAGLAVSDVVAPQVDALEANRALLEMPDPIQPLLKMVEDTLRTDLRQAHERLSDEYSGHMSELEQDDSWSSLTSDERSDLLARESIGLPPSPELGSSDALLTTLDAQPLQSWRDRKDALQLRFARVRDEAMRRAQPAAQPLELPRRMLSNEAEAEDWLDDVRRRLKDALSRGPVVLK